MKNIVMYTGPMCAFCDAAKRLFKRNNVSFKEIDIGNDVTIREEMIKKSKKLLIANKESIICGWEILNKFLHIFQQNMNANKIPKSQKCTKPSSFVLYLCREGYRSLLGSMRTPGEMLTRFFWPS